MAKPAKESLVSLIIIFVIIAGTAGASFSLVPSNTVFPQATVDRIFSYLQSGPSEAAKPFRDFRSSAKVSDKSGEFRDSDEGKNLTKIYEFNADDPHVDADNPNSPFKKFSNYTLLLIGINFVYLLAIVLAAIYIGTIGSVCVAALSSGIVYYLFAIKEMAAISSQLKACFVFTHIALSNNDQTIVTGLANRYYEFYAFLSALIKFDMQLKIGIFLGVALIASILFDKKSSKYFVQLEDQASEVMRIQAENNQMKNSLTDIRKLDEKNRMLSARLSSLQTLTRVISKSLNYNDVVKESLNVVQQVVNAEKCSIWLIDENNGNLILKEAIGWKDEEKEKNNSYPSEDAGLVGQALKTGKPMSSTEQQQDYTSMTTGSRMPSKACSPLKHGEKNLGVINIEKFTENVKIEQEEIRMLELISTLSSVAIENANLFKKTEDLANKDGLTKLFTRRYMENFLDGELEKSRRYNHPLSIAMTDIDHFKSFNDTYGHQIGDFVLEETAKVLRSLVRNVDLPARYGGEEFIAILPETEYKGAFAFAERLRKAIEGKTYTDAKTGHKLRVTISIGVASFPLHSKEKTELIKKADTALYLAKEQGRNRVKVAPITKEQLAIIQGGGS